MSEQDALIEYHGGCHCKAIRFTVNAPTKLVCFDCNCSICAMKKNCHFIVPKESFSIQDGGESRLTEYRFGTEVARHMFCSICGVQSFYFPRSNPDGVAVTIHCLDKASREKADILVEWFDGENWDHFYQTSDIAKYSANKGRK